MIAKTTIGATIRSALAYGAGELGERSRKQKDEKVDLLATYNLSAQAGDVPRLVHGSMAAEMQAVVRDYPGRCQNPVWHTSLSLPAGETLDAQAWKQAVDIYLREVGIDAHQHQVAVFRHRDTAHDHVHIYANRVGMDGGAAIKTGWNYKANVKATRQIEQALSLTPLTKESKRTSLNDHVAEKQVAREVVAKALKSVLQHERPTNLEELLSDLEKHRITAKIHSNSQGPNGVSFQAEGHQAVKGTSVGYKFNQLSVLLEANRAQYEAEINRLREEAGRAAEAEKLREIAEKALKQAQQEVKEVYEKRDLIRDAFEKAEEARQQQEIARQQAEQERNVAREQASKLNEAAKSHYYSGLAYKNDNDRLEQEKAALEEARNNAEAARQQAEQARDQAQNQPPQVLIQEKIKEVVQSDPADKARIEQLEREKQAISSAKADAEKARELAEKARKEAVEGWTKAYNAYSEVSISNTNNYTNLISEQERNKELEKQIGALRQKLQLSILQEQITNRVQEFYLIASPGPKGVFQEGYSGQKNADLLISILKDNALPAVAAYLAHDLPNPMKMAKVIESKLHLDWESHKAHHQGVSTGTFSFVPSDKRESWYKKPDGEQKISWQKEPSAAAWEKLVEQKVPDGLLRKLARLSDHSLDPDSPKLKQTVVPKTGIKFRP